MENVRLLSTLGLMGAMRSLSSTFETATGIHVDADFAPAGFSAGRVATAKHADAADRLLRYLASPDVVPVLRQSGLEP